VPARPATAENRANKLTRPLLRVGRNRIFEVEYHLVGGGPAALARNLSLLPGTVRQVRRGACPGGASL